MSRIFGEIRQIAFVVRDLDKAMAYWTRTLGVGPFFVKRELVFQDYLYRGQAAKSPRISIALANSGALQIELVQQHDDLRSVYREFLDGDREGFQHVSAWLNSADFDRKKAELLERGMTIAQEGRIPSSGVRLAYFATDTAPGGLVYEISDLLEPHHYERIMNIAKAAASWDGEEPVREGAK